MDGSVSAVGSIFNASWRIATVVYELKAVGEQTRDLLDTTSQVSSTLQHAQVLRRQRSGLLNGTEKKWIDDVLHASDKAVGNVAALIEPARVDMQTRCSKIRFVTRGQFVLRDLPKVDVQLSRLTIAHQGLNSAMVVLCNREGSISSTTEVGAPNKADGGASDNELKPPPSYEAVELLEKRRESILNRRASKLPMAVSVDAGLDKLKPLEEDPKCLPMVNVAEVQPTPITSPQPNEYAEFDGLQVVENTWIGDSCPPSTGRPGSMRATSGTVSADHCPPSYSPSFPTASSNSRYIPCGPSRPLDPPPQRYTPQPPACNLQHRPHSTMPSSSPVLKPQWNRPSYPPFVCQAYANTSSTTLPPQPTMSDNHIATDYDTNYRSIQTAQSMPGSELNANSYCRSPESAFLDPYIGPSSCPSTATRESSSAARRQQGRERGRAWLEHQAGKQRHAPPASLINVDGNPTPAEGVLQSRAGP